MKNKFMILTTSLLLLSSVSVVYASDAIKALLFPVQFVFNDEIKVLDEEYVTLNYKDRTYVPARFIAENLDARIDYDPGNQKVILNNTNRFHASNVKIGDSIVGMEVVTLDPNDLDHDTVGTVQFSGETIVTGTYSYQKSDVLHGEIFSFIIDQNSTNKIPILENDTRDLWFVFTNISEAKQLFEIHDDEQFAEGKAAVVIDDYFINYQHKDVYNTSTLNEVYLHSGK